MSLVQAPLQAVIFDIDGTLYPNHRMYRLSFTMAMKNLKLLRAFYSVRQELRTYHSITDFYTLQNTLMAEKMEMDENEMRHVINTKFYLGWERLFQYVSLYSGLVETLSWIKSKGLKLAALSDFPVEGKLKWLGIREYFDLAQCSEDSGHLKPSPVPFQLLLSELGLKAENCLFVGNSYSYDIKGAHNVGMRTAHRAFYKRSSSPAEITFRSYKVFLPWLQMNLEHLK